MASSMHTQDLRSDSKEHGRFKAHNAKWIRGAHAAPGVRCPNHWNSHVAGNLAFSPESCETCSKRPIVREATINYTSMRQANNKKEISRDNNMTRKAFRSAVVEAVEDAHDDLSDSSGDVDIDETSAAPELNEVMYSFDAPTGPSRGNDILSYAITQAVQRYENNETDKIVKREYDLVLDAEDEPESYVADADDDFELIDESHLK